MDTERENHLITLFILLIAAVVLLITFVLLGFQFYDNFLKLAYNFNVQNIINGGGGAM